MKALSLLVSAAAKALIALAISVLGLAASDASKQPASTPAPPATITVPAPTTTVTPPPSVASTTVAPPATTPTGQNVTVPAPTAAPTTTTDTVAPAPATTVEPAPATTSAPPPAPAQTTTTVAPTTTTQATTSTPTGPQPVVFLIAGQSNAAGRGLPLPAQTPVAHLDEVKRDGTKAPALEPLDGPDVTTNPTAAGYGPATTFGKGMLARYPDGVDLVQAASGGTFLDESCPAGGQLWNPAFQRLRALGEKVAGIVLFQGEEDATRPDYAISWADRFARCVRDWRAALGYDVPVVFAQIGSNPNDPQIPAWDVVMAQQASVSLPGVAMIRTDDLAHDRPNSPHFTVDGYDTIGRRFATAMLTLVGG